MTNQSTTEEKLYTQAQMDEALASANREIDNLKSQLRACERATQTVGSQLNRTRESSPEYDRRDVRSRYD